MLSRPPRQITSVIILPITPFCRYPSPLVPVAIVAPLQSEDAVIPLLVARHSGGEIPSKLTAASFPLASSQLHVPTLIHIFFFLYKSHILRPILIMIRNVRPLNVKLSQRQLPASLWAPGGTFSRRFSSTKSDAAQEKHNTKQPIRVGTVGVIACVTFIAGVFLGRQRPDEVQGLPKVKYADRGGMLIVSHSHVRTTPRSHLQAAKEIESILGEEAISFDEEDIEAHSFSDWSSCNSLGRPVAIAYPKSTDGVSKVAAICNKHRVPIGASHDISLVPMLISQSHSAPGLLSKATSHRRTAASSSTLPS